MDNNFYQDDELEQFLRDEVKQHRMYPSDHVWKSIRTELHGYKAWPALTFISLFILTALTISTLLINHPDKHIAYYTTRPAVTVPEQEEVVSAVEPSHANRNDKDYFERMNAGGMNAETFANTTAQAADVQEAILPVVNRNTANDAAAIPVKTNERTQITARLVTRRLPVASSELVQVVPAAGTEAAASGVTEAAIEKLTPEEDHTEKISDKAETRKPGDNHANADEFLKDFDYVMNRPKPRNSKFGIQFYLTPSTSYRKLSDEKVKEVLQPSVSSAVPLPTSTSGDVNTVVRHKPAIGLEAGFAILYNMSDRLKFKTGLQLNVRQYYIETFQSRTNDLTSLSLINSRGVETINFYSPYNNNTGYKQTQLDNQLYQVSLPLGLQWEMVQGKHFGITSEASVQPTLTLNSNTFLLSTDYKHYTTGAEFIRKWNVNTSVGVNLTFTSGKASWQVGPQVRYQHLPTYSNSYPIKEYLLDYGVKIGYTRQMW